MKRVIYTVLTGNSDQYSLKEPTFVSASWDYVCFSDRENLTSNTWHIRKLENDESLTPTKLSRKPKILNDRYLPDYDLSIYLDSKFTIRFNLDVFLKRYMDDGYSICVMSHPKRNDIYEEFRHCIRRGIGEKKKLQQQRLFYEAQGLAPNKFSLTAGGIIIRRHHDKYQRKAMEFWFDQLRRWSSRDQLSFTFMRYKFPEMKLKIMPWNKVYPRFI